jgi:penicillin-binding protein 1A
MPSERPRRGDGPRLTSDRPKRESSGSGISPRSGGGGPRKPSGGSRGGKGGGGRKGGGRKKKTQGFGAKLKAIIFSRGMAAALGSLFLTGFIVMLGAVIYFAHDLPDISKLNEPRQTYGIQMLSAEGDIIKSYGHIYGDTLRFDEIPPSLVRAVIATEDRNYFQHFGLDPWGIARAMVVNLQRGRFVQGGSTITQQLAKNVFLTPDRTLKRKIQEMLLAFWLESRFSKEEILSIYLNRVYLGAGNYGVDAAARHYFQKSAREVSLAESALLAGLLKAPSRYAPTANLDVSKKRARQVLLNMVDAGTLSQSEADAAFNGFRLPESIEDAEGQSGRYFADWVVDQLPDVLPNIQDDIIIYTTMEPRFQQQAEEALNAVLTPEVMTQKKVGQAAIVSMRPSGAVVAMIGGRDYAKSPFNRATQAKRQPGSSFKAVVYTAAVENGWRPDQLVEDRPITLTTSSGPWTPRNYTGKYLGTVPLREAVAQSLNTVAVQAAMSAGLGNVLNAAKRLGVRSPLPQAWAVSLGAAEVSLLEMTTVYAHFSSNGYGVRPFGIREIRRRADNTLLFERRDVGAYIVLSRDTVAIMNNLLSGVITTGTGRAAAIGRPAAGKTGTTSDYKDAWFLGYTPDLTTGVWVGNDNNTPTAKVTGGQLPAQIWSAYMKAAEADFAVAELPMSYGSGSFLPWFGADTAPQSAPAAEDTSAPGTSQPTPRPRDVNLGKSFWDKLLDAGSRGKVEYDYPSSDPRRR